MQRYLIVVLICIFLKTNGIEHLLKAHWPLQYSLLRTSCSSLWSTSLLGILSFSYSGYEFFVSYMDCNYILTLCGLPFHSLHGFFFNIFIGI